MSDGPRIVDPAGKATGGSPSGKLIATESIPEPWVVIYREGERIVMRDIPCLAVVETPLGDVHLVGVTNTLTPYAWDDSNVMEYMPRGEAQRRQKAMAARQKAMEKAQRKQDRNLEAVASGSMESETQRETEHSGEDSGGKADDGEVVQ